MDNDVKFADHNAIATFPDLPAAREAIGALEDRGVDGSHISLLGRQGEKAVEDPDTAGRDERMMDTHAKTAAGGIVGGAGVGGAVGFLAGIAAFGIPGVGPAVAGGIWALTLGGAAAGSGVGLAATSYAKIKQSEAWDLTYDTVSNGQVVVGVHTADESELEPAVGVLREHGSGDVTHFDGEGNRLPTP
ncbi:MAG: hypothetical protein M3R09_00665 [Actinomycetota bacterium]|nr:hypothetical protein [Actinomycetota bacterium]